MGSLAPAGIPKLPYDSDTEGPEEVAGILLPQYHKGSRFVERGGGGRSCEGL